MATILGIQDPWIVVAYLLCIASAGLCVVYGVVNWNRGDDSVTKKDVKWAVHEEKVKKEVVD